MAGFSYIRYLIFESGLSGMKDLSSETAHKPYAPNVSGHSMKHTIIIIFGLLSGVLVRASNDSLDFYVINHSDTIYIHELATIFYCDYLISTDRSHDKCLITIDGNLYTGDIYYRLKMGDSTIELFDGEIVDGLIKNGTLLR